jgi:hypothetical protein
VFAPKVRCEFESSLQHQLEVSQWTAKILPEQLGPSRKLWVLHTLTVGVYGVLINTYVRKKVLEVSWHGIIACF